MRARKKRVNYKRVIVSLLFVGLIAIVLLFGSKSLVSNVMAKNEVQKPIILSGLSIKKDHKEAPVEFNGKVRKVAYLTIDDGPSQYTKKLLDILDKEKVKATFFLIGPNIKQHEDMVKRMYDEGHYVGMHSMTHNYTKLYTNRQLVPEMKQLQNIIKDVTGKKPVLFRSPYGSFPGIDSKIKKQIHTAHLKTWDWTVDSNDWRHQNQPMKIVGEIEKQLTEPREIILIHDKKGTVKALPHIIKMLKEKGYELEVYNESQHFPLNFLHDNNI